MTSLRDVEIELLEECARLKSGLCRVLELLDHEVASPPAWISDVRQLLDKPTIPDYPFDYPSDLVQLIAGMARFLGGCSAMPLFQNDREGLIKWMTLAAFELEPKLGTAVLARQLGMSTKRTARILEALEASGLLSAGLLTASGTKALADVNQQLHPILAKLLRNDPAKLQRTAKALRHLSRVYHGPVSDSD